MDRRLLCILLFAVIPACTSWHTVGDRRDRELRKLHFHSKRHMQTDNESKKKSSTQKPREMRKKKDPYTGPSGHLTPLDEDDIENDEFVSVAIGPPPIRIKSNKQHWKPNPRPGPTTNNITTTATNFVKDILTQLGRELLNHQVSEDFIFGQYVGNSMKNLTNELRLKMQHEILDLVMKYQKINSGEVIRPDDKIITFIGSSKTSDKSRATNETEENWPDFTNLAKIVG